MDLYLRLVGTGSAKINRGIIWDGARSKKEVLDLADPLYFIPPHYSLLILFVPSYRSCKPPSPSIYPEFTTDSDMLLSNPLFLDSSFFRTLNLKLLPSWYTAKPPSHISHSAVSLTQLLYPHPQVLNRLWSIPLVVGRTSPMHACGVGGVGRHACMATACTLMDQQ